MSLCVGDWGRKPSTSRTVCTEPCTASKLMNARIRAGESQFKIPIKNNNVRWVEMIKKPDKIW